MKKSRSVLKILAGAVGLAVAGYVLVNTIPDIVRYVRISTM